MNKLKVIKVNDNVEFDNGCQLYSDHSQDCCESHYLDFTHIKLEDFEGLEFDLSNDNFFTRIEDYGISLNPTNGFPVRIPGYGYNNGYYSHELTLILTNNKDFTKSYDITDCQVIND